MNLELQPFSTEFAVCQVSDLAQVDFTDTFCFIGKTDQELSLVCPVTHVPENALSVDSGWKAFRIQGVLDFSLIGILSRIATCLASEKIGIFAISTYNTDYVLTKSEHFDAALAALKKEGYSILPIQ